MDSHGEVSTTPSRALLVIHGVGDPSPGDVLDELRLLDQQSTESTTEWSGDEAIRDGERFLRWRAAQAQTIGGIDGVREVLEVNWRDLQPAPQGRLGALLALPTLALSAFESSLAGWSGWKPATARFLFRHWMLWMAVVPALALACVAAIHAGAWWSPWLGVAVCAFPLALGVSVPRHANLLHSAAFWSVLLGVHSILAGRVGVGLAGTLAGGVYVISQVALLLLMAVVVVASARLHRADDAKSAGAFLALVGLLFVSAFGATLSALALYVVQLEAFAASKLAVDAWVAGFHSQLPYDTAPVERVFTRAVVLLAGLAFLLALVFVIRVWTGIRPNGESARSSIRLIAWCTIASLGLAGAVFAGSTLCGLLGGNDPGGTTSAVRAADAYAIYRDSAFRILPVLMLVALIAGNPLDAIGDVLRYIVPDGSYRERARRRFRVALEVLREYPDVLVVAHSQGSVIALDALGGGAHRDGDAPDGSDRVTLVTIGSPIGSIYARFIDREWTRAPQVRRWLNFHRESDYIGGPAGTGADQSTAAANRQLKSTGFPAHVHYFRDPKFWEELAGSL